MAHYRTHISTLMPRDQAFSLLSRFDRAAEWDPGVDAGTMLTPEPVGPGSRFALRARFCGRSLPLEYEVTEFESGSQLTLRAENPFVRSIDTISFTSAAPATPTAGDPQGTDVTYDARLEPKGLMRLAAPLLAIAFRRIGDRAASGLHAFLQSPVRR